MGDTAPEIVELGLGYADLEDQQRDRDREHAVAERLDPAGAPAIPTAAHFHGTTADPAADDRLVHRDGPPKPAQEGAA